MPLTACDLLSLTATLAMASPVDVTVTVVSGRTDAEPLAGEIFSDDAAAAEVGDELLVLGLDPAAAGLCA